MAKGNRSLKAKFDKAKTQARFGLKDRPHKLWAYDQFKGQAYNDLIVERCADRRKVHAPVPTVSAWAESGQVRVIRNGVVVA